MEMTLAENIRRFRKERSLTQEQLAEALGVTPGAVYKWEAKLSVPELNLIMEMADYFDTSVDVLLGYQMKDNRLETTVKRLQEYRRHKNPEGLAEAEKAIQKFPNSFPVAREGARLYLCFGCENRRKDQLRRALELLESAGCCWIRTRIPKSTNRYSSEKWQRFIWAWMKQTRRSS